MSEAAALAALLAWGTAVGLDLISVPQIMIARPLVAGPVAGWIAGDPAAGLLVGVLLELFALDVLPVGAVRYPDYGPAAVGGAAAAAGAPGVLGIGVAVTVGLAVAYAGEWSIVATRRRMTAQVRRETAALESGDPAAVRRLHLAGLAWDALRAAAVTGLGLALAYLVRRWPPVTLRPAVLLTAAAIGAALATGTLGALRLPERRSRIGWFAAGLAAGFAWVVLR